MELPIWLALLGSTLSTSSLVAGKESSAFTTFRLESLCKKLQQLPLAFVWSLHPFVLRRKPAACTESWRLLCRRDADPRCKRSSRFLGESSARDACLHPTTASTSVFQEILHHIIKSWYCQSSPAPQQGTSAFRASGHQVAADAAAGLRSVPGLQGVPRHCAAA